MNNLQKIQSMSHSELTAFLENNPLDCSSYDYCDERCPRLCNGVCLPVGEWLKQEVKQDAEECNMDTATKTE